MLKRRLNLFNILELQPFLAAFLAFGILVPQNIFLKGEAPVNYTAAPVMVQVVSKSSVSGEVSVLPAGSFCNFGHNFKSNFVQDQGILNLHSAANCFSFTGISVSVPVRQLSVMKTYESNTVVVVDKGLSPEVSMQPFNPASNTQNVAAFTFVALLIVLYRGRRKIIAKEPGSISAPSHVLIALQLQKSAVLRC